MGSCEYATPQWLIDALTKDIGYPLFELDPCAMYGGPTKCADLEWTTEGFKNKIGYILTNNKNTFGYSLIKVDKIETYDDILEQQTLIKSNLFTWDNPPYSTKLKTEFVTKDMYNNNGYSLIPASVNSKLFHEIIAPCAKGVFFFEKRISFIPKGGKEKKGNDRDSMLVVWGDEAYTRLYKALEKGCIKGNYYEC